MTEEAAVTDCAALQGDTYPMPKDGWVCFHCGERFTKPGTARDHFGETPDGITGCIIKAGEERGLLMALRKTETEAANLRAAIVAFRDSDGSYTAENELMNALEAIK